MIFFLVNFGNNAAYMLLAMHTHPNRRIIMQRSKSHSASGKSQNKQRSQGQDSRSRSTSMSQNRPHSDKRSK